MMDKHSLNLGDVMETIDGLVRQKNIRNEKDVALGHPDRDVDDCDGYCFTCMSEIAVCNDDMTDEQKAIVVANHEDLGMSAARIVTQGIIAWFDATFPNPKE